MEEEEAEGKERIVRTFWKSGFSASKDRMLTPEGCKRVREGNLHLEGEEYAYICLVAFRRLFSS
jgi:hypothetical protein